MKDINKEIIRLTAREVLLTLFDLNTPFYLAHWRYRKSVKKYLEKRSVDRALFFEKIRYLRRKGYIETFVEGREKFAELTNKGKEHAEDILLDDLEIKRPLQWDGKWRGVMFDIKEDDHVERDIFRVHLKKLNFIQVQKSVYVYPFECTKEISFLARHLSVEEEVTIMIAEIIQGEDKIINTFIENGILTKKDIKR